MRSLQYLRMDIDTFEELSIFCAFNSAEINESGGKLKLPYNICNRKVIK